LRWLQTSSPCSGSFGADSGLIIVDNRRQVKIRRASRYAVPYLRIALIGIGAAALTGCGVSLKLPSAQTITFTTKPPASALYSSQFTVAAGATSGLAVTFTSLGACTNSGATYTMTSGEGACSVIASQSGNSKYAAAPQVTQTVAANLASQTITFTANPPASSPYEGQFTVAASATSGLAVTFTSSGACINSGANYTVDSGAGACSVIASQTGNANYAAAQQVTQTVAATLAPQTITFTKNPPALAPYDSQFTVAASATSGLTVIFTSLGACTNSSATYTLASSAGSCSVIASQPGNANYAAAQQVTQTVTAGVLTANVCPNGQTTPVPCSETFTLAFYISAGTTIARVNILTTGAPNLDFQAQASDANTTLCTAQTYLSATTCTVDVTFAPLYPGTRTGAVQILDGSGIAIAGTDMYGIGVGPAIAFNPANQSSLSGGPGFSFGEPASVAIDGAGNLFVADFGKDAVYEMLAASGYATVNTLGGGFAFGGPAGVALDGAGNLFVADFYNQALYELPAVGGYTTVNQLASFISGQPTDVALDSNGNIFVSDHNSSVYELLASGGYTTTIRLASGFTFGLPSGLAVDGNGNVFLSDSGNVAIYEILAAGGYTTVNQLARGFAFKSPLGVSVDTSGNVFVADGSFTTVFEISSTDGYTQVMPLGSGFGSPWSVTVGPNGNVYVPDVGAVPAAIQLIQRSQPPLFNFASTVVGSTSADSPQSVVIQNTGNRPLAAIAPGLLVTGPNFVQVSGSGTPEDCTSSFTLTPGATCNLSLSFEPQSVGPLTGTAVFTDNALNANAATQSIELSGTGTNGP
jgi:large repetitive protein